jgi:3-hydroxyacyl-CoA dehydrogenase
VKEKVFQKLDEVMKPGAILATNTSTLDVDKIASFTQRPQDVIGTHFFSPANVMKLLEVVRGKATAKDVLATVMQLGKKMKEDRRCLGRLRRLHRQPHVRQYIAQAGVSAGRGRDAAAGRRALEKFGIAMGPFRMGDLAGNDIGWAIRKRHYAEDPRRKAPRSTTSSASSGRFGQKTGAGWYRYEPGKRDPIPDPVVEKLIVDELPEAPRRSPTRRSCSAASTRS